MNKSIDRIKYGASLAATAALSFIKINLVGGLSTGLATASMLLIMVQQSLGEGPGPIHAGGNATIVALFSMRPIASILTAAILIVSSFLFFALGNKYILMKLSNRLLHDKGEELLYPLIDKVLARIRKSQPDLLRKGGDALRTKLQIIQEIKDSSESKWTKRITVWGLKRADLDGVDLGAEDVSITKTIRDRVVNALRTVSSPSRSFFWIILAVQWAVVVLVLFEFF